MSGDPQCSLITPCDSTRAMLSVNSHLTVWYALHSRFYWRNYHSVIFADG